MAYNLLQRRVAGDESATEFAATVASMPPGPDSAVPDVPTEFGGDSLPAPVDATVEQRPTLSHIGRYALKGPLGAGGLGQVHEAWDPLLSRTVAVKTLQFELETPARVSLDGLFLNEARAAAGLSHPNIVTIHDAGLSARGVYIAMERLRGRDLRQALAAGWRPTQGEAAQLVRRVADALAYAHARGVVHCDIKPANIFLCRNDKPKLLDFGIARVAHGAALPLLDGLIAGSPHYLAPEQLEAGPIDARTDIHALGVVLYELLTGRKAYNGDSVEQITSAVLANHPAPAHELRPGVSRTLSAIAARAMARDPAARYASAEAMAAELRRWASRHAEPATQTLSAAAAKTEPRAPHRGGLLVGGLLVVACGIAAGLAVRRPAAEPYAGTSAGRSATAAPLETPLTTSLTTPLTTPLAPGPASGDRPASSARPLSDNPAAAPRPQPARARTGAAVAARDTRLALAPESLPSGTLQLAITPWGEVEVDGQAAGTTPPLTRLSLPEGRHTITVRNDDAPPYSTTVQVSADKPVTVRYRFGP